MPDPQYQDAITYKQPFRKEIKEDKNKIFEDKNLFLVLDSLRENNKPMTVEDLEVSFKKSGEEKSKKSIYRYLKKLEDENLVVQAGKRVYPLKNKLKTQTLYMRTARIFFPVGKSSYDCILENTEQKDKMIELIGLLLSKKIGKKMNSNQCLKEHILEIRKLQNDLTIKLIDDTDDEIADKLKMLDWKHTQHLLDNIGLLALFCEEKEWYKELSTCFE